MPAAISAAADFLRGNLAHVARRPAPKAALAAARALSASGLAVDEGGDFPGEARLRLVERGVLLGGELAALVDGEEGEQEEEALDVRVGDVAPVLEEIVGARHRGVEEEGALLGLAHLLAVARHHEGEGQAEALGPLDAADELDARDDVAPLVVAADLEAAAVALVELEEIVALEELVVELDEGEAGLHPHLVGLEGEHPVDREVPAYVAEEVDVVEVGEPVLVVRRSTGSRRRA